MESVVVVLRRIMKACLLFLIYFLMLAVNMYLEVASNAYEEFCMVLVLLAYVGTVWELGDL